MGYLSLIENYNYPVSFSSVESVEDFFSDERNCLNERIEVLDLAIELVLSLCSSEEFFIIKLLLSGYKKKDISKVLNVSLLKINTVQEMFVTVLVEVLSKFFDKPVSKRLICEYLKDLKKHRHKLNQAWDIWTRNRNEKGGIA